MTRIYLDNAATSWPKPESVYQTVDQFQRQLGAPAGRGGYAQAMEVDRRLQQVRVALASLLDAPSSDRILFTYSGTDSLNLALCGGLLAPGDHVVTTVCEHNSVLRPLKRMEQQLGLQITYVDCDPDGHVRAEAILNEVHDQTRLVAITHASNVTGAIQPVAEVCQPLLEHPAVTLVDAAQTVGHLPISVQQMGCDLLAAPGHKGLLGPTGTGFLYVAPGREQDVPPWRIGGTGTSSESDEPPLNLPSAYEAGNQNVGGLLGVGAGIKFLQEQGLPSLQQRQHRLCKQLIDALRQLEQVTVFGPPSHSVERLPLVCFQVHGLSPQDVAILLEQIGSIQVRAGYHCAPRMHQTLKTDTMGGTVRISLGPFSTESDIVATVDAVGQLVKLN